MNHLQQLLYIIKKKGKCHGMACKECILEDKCSIGRKKMIVTNRDVLYQLAKETIREML